MKILTAEEAKDYMPLSNGRTSKVYAILTTLQVGEVLIITRQDWKGKSAPYAIVNGLAKKTGRTFLKGRTPDGTGWAIKRMS